MKKKFKTIFSTLSIALCLLPEGNNSVRGSGDESSYVEHWNKFSNVINRNCFSEVTMALMISFFISRYRSSLNVKVPKFVDKNEKEPILPDLIKLPDKHKNEIKTFKDLKQIAKENWRNNGWRIKDNSDDKAVVTLIDTKIEGKGKTAEDNENIKRCGYFYKSYFQPYGILGPIYAVDANYVYNSLSDNNKDILYKGGLPPDDTPVCDVTEYVYDCVLATLLKLQDDLKFLAENSWKLPNAQKMTLGNILSLFTYMIGNFNGKNEKLNGFDVTLKLLADNKEKPGCIRKINWLDYANMVFNFLLPGYLFDPTGYLYSILGHPQDGCIGSFLDSTGGCPYYLYHGSHVPLIGVMPKNNCTSEALIRDNFGNYVPLEKLHERQDCRLVLMHANSGASPCVSTASIKSGWVMNGDVTNPSMILDPSRPGDAEIVGSKEGYLLSGLNTDLSSASLGVGTTMKTVNKICGTTNTPELVYSLFQCFHIENCLKMTHILSSLCSIIDAYNKQKISELSNNIANLNKELKNIGLPTIPFSSPSDFIKEWIPNYNWDTIGPKVLKFAELLKNNLSYNEIKNLADQLSKNTPHLNLKYNEAYARYAQPMKFVEYKKG